MSSHVPHFSSYFPLSSGHVCCSQCTAARQWSKKTLINLTWPSWPHWGKSHWSASCSDPGHSGKLSSLPCIGYRAGRHPPRPPSSRTAEPARDRESLCCMYGGMHECVPGGVQTQWRRRQWQKIGSQRDTRREMESCKHFHTGSHLSRRTSLDRWDLCSHTGKHFTVTASQAGPQPRSLSLLRRTVPMQTAI